MNWFYSENGAQKGPVDDATFRALVSNGTIHPDTLVWREGMTDWSPLSAAAPELAPAGAPPPRSAGAPPPLSTGATPAVPATAGAPIPEGTVPNHLVGAILSTLCSSVCCCLPGIPAIVYAAQVNGRLAAGDLEGARKASSNANVWMWIAFGIGIAVWAVNIASVLLSLPQIVQAAEEARAAAGG